MTGLYLGALMLSVVGMVIIDHKYKLALFDDWRRTLITLAVGVSLFIVWDIAGIASGVFYAGESTYMTGIFLGPEFPVEELFFLSFLCYFTLVLYRYGVKKC